MTSDSAANHHAIAGIPLVLGGNVFGWTADEDTSFAILDTFYENGGRMIDTAAGLFGLGAGSRGRRERDRHRQVGAIARGSLRHADRHQNEYGRRPRRSCTGEGGRGTRQVSRTAAERLRRPLLRSPGRAEEPRWRKSRKGSTPLCKAGKAKELGASNYDANRLAAVLDAAKAAGADPLHRAAERIQPRGWDQYGPALAGPVRRTRRRDAAVLWARRWIPHRQVPAGGRLCQVRTR